MLGGPRVHEFHRSGVGGKLGTQSAHAKVVQRRYHHVADHLAVQSLRIHLRGTCDGD